MMRLYVFDLPSYSLMKKIAIHWFVQLLNQPTAEPDYSNVYSRFSAIVELNLVPFAFVSLLFYPCYSRLLV